MKDGHVTVKHKGSKQKKTLLLYYFFKKLICSLNRKYLSTYEDKNVHKTQAISYKQGKVETPNKERIKAEKKYQ